MLRVAEQVDLIEPIAKFTDPLKGKAGVGNIFNVGLEEWKPIKGVQYDLIWTQWCVGHLTDEELVQYLQVCKSVLTPESGVIVIKENLSTGDADIFDDTDSSVTRLVKPTSPVCVNDRRGCRCWAYNTFDLMSCC